MRNKNQFELDKGLMTDNRIDIQNSSGEEMDFNEDILDDGDVLNIEIGEMEYDPSNGNWKEKNYDSGRYSNRYPNEIKADYRVCSPEPGDSSRGLPNPKTTSKNDNDGNNSKKTWPFAFQIVYGIFALACIGASFVLPYHYMTTHVIASTTVRSDAASASDKEVEKVKTGTYATIKSNSLDGVPVYENAGDNEQITFIPEGKYLKLLDNTSINGKDWAKISYCGIEGWVLMKNIHFVTEKDAFIKEGDTIYMDAQTEFGIKGCEEPSSSSKEVVSGILYGTEYKVKELKNGWAKVDHKGKTCWINMFFMGSYGSKSWKVDTLTKAGAMNMRNEPSEDSKVLCKIPEKTVLTIQEFKNGWGKTEYEGNTGWVMLHYLNPVDADD